MNVTVELTGELERRMRVAGARQRTYSRKQVEARLQVGRPHGAKTQRLPAW